MTVEAVRCLTLPRVLLATIAVLCANAPLPSLASAAEPDAATVSVLSYNVHGLFRWIAKDDPRDRMPTIGWLADRYDVVLFQEDFEFHSELAQQIQNATGRRGNGAWHDPRLALAKLFAFPFTVWIPHFSPPYGAGISTFVDDALLVADDFTREPYGSCNGWLGANGDCWAAKGFLRVTVRSVAGAEVHVYNTHLEAGPSDKSVAVRRSQLEALAEAVERLSAGRAVVVGGDFNVAFIRPGDREMILWFREKLGLADSGAGPELPFWRERDYLLYRSGAGATLSVEAAGEAVEFVGRERALSDHPALYARFRVEPAP